MTEIGIGMGVPFGGGVPFNPASVPGLVSDWNPGALALNDGDPIGSLTDTKSGYNGTGTGTQRPTYRAGAGRPYADYNGTTNGLVTPAIDLTAASQITLIIVGTAASGGDQVFFEQSSNYNSFNDAFVAYREAANTVLYAAKGPNVRTFRPTNPVTTTPTIMHAVYDKVSTNRQTWGGTNGANGGLQNASTTGNNTGFFGNRPCYIGARNQASLRLTGRIYRILLYIGKKTPAEMDYIGQGLSGLYGPTWSNINYLHEQYVFHGDSITNGDGVGVTYPYPQQFEDLSGKVRTWSKVAINGQTVAQMSAAYPASIAPLYNASQYTVQKLIAYGQTNDMALPGGNQDAATTWARDQAYWALAKATGWKVIWGTCLPRSDSPATPVDFDTKRATLNTSIRAGWTGVIDGLFDVAANTSIGENGDSDDPTWYVDKVHPSNAGATIIATSALAAAEAA